MSLEDESTIALSRLPVSQSWTCGKAGITNVVLYAWSASITALATLLLDWGF